MVTPKDGGNYYAYGTLFYPLVSSPSIADVIGSAKAIDYHPGSFFQTMNNGNNGHLRVVKRNSDFGFIEFDPSAKPPLYVLYIPEKTYLTLNPTH